MLRTVVPLQHEPWKEGTTELTTSIPPGSGHEEALDTSDELFKSSYVDNEDMRRMGRSQEFVRHYRLFSMISFVAIATSAWELAMFSVSPAIIDGGLPSAVWSNVWCFIGYTPIILSMSEMASMAPIAGSQYHWVSEFAPAGCQQILSYITGWTSTLAWQAGNALGFFLLGTLVQCIILINNEDYAFPNWHGTLLVIAIVVVIVLINIFGARILPYTQNAIFALAWVAFLGFLVPVWVNAPKASHHQVWGDWQNSGGWSSMPLSVMIGQLPAIAALQGCDAATHMAEEVRNASSAVPKVMIAVFISNFVQTFLTVVTLAYHIPNVKAAMKDSTDYPAIYVLKQSMSLPWLNVILVVICALLMAANISYLAAVCRDLFAFARDSGLPFSPWISKVDKKRRVPTNGYILCGAFASLLSLIYIGSPVAFYAITSLGAVSILQCYVLSIGCLLWRRIKHPETLPYAAFPLGKFGIPLNIAAILFGMWSFFWCFWPQVTPVTAEGFNWASPIFVAVIVGALGYFFASARKRYHGPVTLVKGREEVL